MKVVWKLFAIVTSLLAARVVKSVLDTAWRKGAGDDPPRNPAAPGTDWKQAAAWAAASGTAMALTKVAATNGAAKAWEKATGSLPPGVETVGA